VTARSGRAGRPTCGRRRTGRSLPDHCLSCLYSIFLFPTFFWVWGVGLVVGVIETTQRPSAMVWPGRSGGPGSSGCPPSQSGSPRPRGPLPRFWMGLVVDSHGGGVLKWSKMQSTRFILVTDAEAISLFSRFRIELLLFFLLGCQPLPPYPEPVCILCFNPIPHACTKG